MPIAFDGDRSWRGLSPNDNGNDKGWFATFVIPFSSLDLDGSPTKGKAGRLGVIVHDRDDASGTPIPDKSWPEEMQPDNPATWGEMAFGMRHYVRPALYPSHAVTIRHGLDGATVTDAHVGGHGNCGSGLDHWSEWGAANYAGYSQITIQNQWDISDYPCFSKYYVTFPLESLPPDLVILSATLTLNLIGNAGGGEWGLPPDSYIQVLSIGKTWDESFITWNNAPLATENHGGTWVQPVQTGSAGPYQWDVALPVAEAYRTGQPLRLALYSADGERHTGKYFWSSDAGSEVRPMLTIVLAPADGSSANHWRIALPLIAR
jgi:hypothetical protein